MVNRIYESMLAIMSEVGVIGKDEKNKQSGFNYRGIDTVTNVLQPLFIKHQVFPVPTVIKTLREERETKSGGNLIYTVLQVKYTFYAIDGSYVEAVVSGEGMDTADKSSNKALSAAFKYACFQVFCIPTKEMQDPDATTPPPSVPKAPPEPPKSQTYDNRQALARALKKANLPLEVGKRMLDELFPDRDINELETAEMIELFTRIKTLKETPEEELTNPIDEENDNDGDKI